MKNLLLGLSAVLLLFATSCTKSNSQTLSSNNYWSFKGNTYNVAYCDASSSGIEAYDHTTGTTTNFGYFLLDFSVGGTAHTQGGVCRVVQHPVTGVDEVEIVVHTNSNTANEQAYTATGTNNETVTVTFSGGKMTVTGSGINVQNDHSSSDNSSLNFNITQTQ